MFLENRFEKLIDRISAKTTIPLRVELWNGHQFCLSPNPTVTIVVPKPSALRYFISPDLNKLGEAFVEGHIRAEGSIHELFQVAESLARSFAATTRARFGRLRRHSHSQDTKPSSITTTSRTNSIRCSSIKTWFIRARITAVRMIRWIRRKYRSSTTS